MALSVISSSSEAADTPESASNCLSSPGNAMSCNRRADKFTAMRRCTPRSRQRRICVSAARNVHSVSGRIRSVASAIAMNSLGLISPWVGCDQRSNARHFDRPAARHPRPAHLSWLSAMAARNSPPMRLAHRVFVVRGVNTRRPRHGVRHVHRDVRVRSSVCASLASQSGDTDAHAKPQNPCDVARRQSESSHSARDDFGARG